MGEKSVERFLTNGLTAGHCHSLSLPSNLVSYLAPPHQHYSNFLERCYRLHLIHGVLLGQHDLAALNQMLALELRLSSVARNLSIAHFTTDEKFTDAAYERFETAAPNASHFFFIGPKTPLKYVKSAPVSHVHPASLLNPFFYAGLRKYSFVVLHKLSRFHRLLLRLAPKDINFLWVGLGVDYYDLLSAPGDLLLEKTRQYVRSRESGKEARTSTFGTDSLAKRLFYRFAPLPALLYKVRAFSPVLESEYEQVAERYGSRVPPYIDWNYGSVSQLIDRDAPAMPTQAGAILLGNSATVTNNHMEALDLLHAAGVGSRKIICPLSYGDKGYGEHVSSYGRALFGAQFVPLTNYMPLNDYLELVSGCSVFVANHVRQQGLGNVVSMLHVGARVFLNRRSPVFQDFTRKGAHVNALDDLIEAPHLLEEPLTEEQVADNQRFLKGLSGSAAINEKTRILIGRMSGEERGAKGH